MKILLLNLPWQKNGRFGVRAGSRWPFTSLPEKDGYVHYIPFPFFLAYATALLKQESRDVKLIDSIAENIDEQKCLEKIKSYNPELIIAETSTPSFHNDLRIISRIQKEKFNCQIALCGTHASVFPKQILQEHDFISYILLGEYGHIARELVNCLERGLDISSVPGLAYRQDRKVKINPGQKTLQQLDDLPWPERDDVPIYRYNDGFAGLPVPNVQMLASRGCIYECTFCLWPQTIYGRGNYCKRDYIEVVSEMEYLINRFNFKAVYFDDDVFNIDRGFVIDICSEIKKRGIKTSWAVMARADLMDENMLSTMADAGLYAIKYGIESADDNILRLCRKKMDLKKASSIIRITKQLGIKVHLTFCIGLPGETKQTAKKTAEFIKDMGPDSFQISRATPFPGTEYFDYLKEKGFSFSKDYSDYDGNYKYVITTGQLSHEDLERAISGIYAGDGDRE